MRRKIRIFIMVVFFFSLYYGMNYYVYRSMLRGMDPGESLLWVIRGGFFLIGSLFVINQFLKRKTSIYWISHYGNLWLGFISIAIGAFLIRDVVMFFFRGAGEAVIAASTVIAMILAVGASVYSVYNGRGLPVIRKIRIFSPKLKKGERITVTQLTDIHIGYFSSKEWLRETVKKANAIKSDVTVLTGDIIDDPYKHIQDYAPILGELEAEKGVYAIIGNHELYTGVEEFHAFMEEAGIRTLRNERVKVDQNLTVYGIDDFFKGTYYKSTMKLSEILADSDAERFNLLLAHQPVKFPEAVKLGMDLQLSGHTHGGQIPPLEWIVKFYFKYPWGLYKEEDAHIYTSPGTGVWGPSMRFLSKNEITRFEIRGIGEDEKEGK